MSDDSAVHHVFSACTADQRHGLNVCVLEESRQVVVAIADGDQRAKVVLELAEIRTLASDLLQCAAELSAAVLLV